MTQIKPQNFSFSLFTLLLVGCQLELNNPSKLVATASPLPDAVQVPFSQSFNFTDFTTSTLSDTTLFQTLDLSAALSTISQSDLGSASPGFSLGTFSGTFWDIPATFLRMDYTGTNRAFPNGSSATSGWQNMTSNVLLLHFEDAGGAVTFSDSSSSGLSLSCVAGCPTTSALGQVSNAESFPGGTMLRVPVAATFNSQTSFSISTWVKTAGAADQTIFSSYDGVHGYRVYLNPAGSLRSFNDATGVIDSQTTLNDGAWHHVVSIWGGGVNVLYVDGSARIAPPASFTPTSQENQIAGSCTGPNSTVCAQTLTGSLDEFAFFDRSLTPSEVSDIYERQSAVHVGTYDSRVIDAGGTVPWTSFSWTPGSPYFKAFPNNGAIEAGYGGGNANMADNLLLLHLDEAAGYAGVAAEAPDSSGNAHHASLQGGGSARTLPGKLSAAVEFRNANNLQTATAVNLAGNFSVDFWMKPMHAESGGEPISISAADFHLKFSINPATQRLSFQIGDGAAWRITATSVPSLTNGTWYHIVGTYDGTDGKLWINELLRATGTQAGLTVNDVVNVGMNPATATSFDGLIDELAIFGHALTASEVAEHFTRAGVRVRYQLRSCASATCAGTPFVGNDLTAATYFSEAQNATTGLPALTLPGGFTSQRYFQYRLLMESDIFSVAGPPFIQRADVGPAHFSAGSPTLLNQVAPIFTTLTTFTETLGPANAGTVQYQLSNDGATFSYFNGATWATASSSLTSNSAATVNAQLASFATQVGTGRFYYKSFLVSPNGASQVELKNVTVTGTQPGI